MELAVAAGIRVLRGQRVGEHVELRGSFRDGDARPQASGQQERLLQPIRQELRPPRFDERGLRRRDERLDRDQAIDANDRLRRDPDHGQTGPSQAHGPAEDGGVPAEPVLPGVVRQHDEGRIAGPQAFVGEERAAELGIQLRTSK